MISRVVRKIDKALYQMFDPPTQHCDGCGEEYPMYYLTHVTLWSGDFCKRCLVYEGGIDDEQDK